MRLGHVCCVSSSGSILILRVVHVVLLVFILPRSTNNVKRASNARTSGTYKLTQKYVGFLGKSNCFRIIKEINKDYKFSFEEGCVDNDVLCCTI